MAQSALSDLGVPIYQDGAWGPSTQTAMLASSPDAILAGLVQEASDYYHAIVTHHPASAKYLAGWLKRAEALP